LEWKDSTSEALANAALIAAAPELLEQLKNAYEALILSGAVNASGPVAKGIKRAIARAEGKE
jgi:hypothetical protein